MRKLNIKWGIALVALLCGSFSLMGCDDENETSKYVDLRYRVQDSYSLEATSPLEIQFQVKSSDPWEVFGMKDWNTITPNQGEPSETKTVSIVCKNNIELDDRIDTISIKSDFRIGKRFVIIQKGIAYLSLADEQNFELERANGQKAFKVLSNQKWTTEVTKGTEWLSIPRGAEGGESKKDKVEEVLVSCKDNFGEQRSGEITVYDRHHVACGTVICTQKGVVLNPEKFLYKVYHLQQTLEIPVECDVNWTVVKEDEDDSWYSLEQTELSGNANIIVKFSEHTGSSIRDASLILKTKTEGNFEVIQKTIRLKQGYKPITQHFEFDGTTGWNPANGTVTFKGDDAHFTPGRATHDNAPAGLYSFRIKEMSVDAYAVIHFCYNDGEIRFHLNATSGMTDVSSSPYIDTQNIPFDKTKPQILSMNLTEDNGFYRCDWSLNGVNFFSKTTGVAFNQNAWTIYIGCWDHGSTIHDYYEYTPPIEWGE